ncbi:Oxidoreductase, molybdopterin-binding domain-containing protein [Pyronema domesticum]|nr:Oxidoreductase, molybdopterin-binding domain-containing protein [Pyronema domesticum]
MLLEYSVEKPLNREPPMRELVESFITTADTAYDRNHGPLPHIDATTFRLHIDGNVARSAQLSIESLRKDYQQHTVIAALQCAGNRRHTMRTKVKEVDGIDWNDGAVCNCTWRGPLLADVLVRLGLTIKTDVGHVHFNCSQTDVQDDSYYGSSIPLERCLDKTKKIILALDMNDEPLNVNHGFPIRVVMPGIAGARWTKWLDRILVKKCESNNFYMQRDYKILPPCVTSKAQALEYWPKIPAIQGLPINSVVAYPEPGTAHVAGENGELEVCGYALPQADDGPVVKVEVSSDKGATWDEAEIVYPAKEELATPEGQEMYKWGWVIWKYKMPKPQVSKITRDTKIWSRAKDLGGNMQDGTVPWNFRGVAYNAYGETENLKVMGVERMPNGIGGLKL